MQSLACSAPNTQTCFAVPQGVVKWPPLYEAAEPAETLRPCPPRQDAAARASWRAGLRPGAALDLK